MEDVFDKEEYSRKIYNAMYFERGDRIGSKKLAEEVINIAQVNNDIDLEFQAKMLFLQCATFLDDSEGLLATYPWILAQMDQYPGRFDEHAALWAYKWVINILPNFPHIGLHQIEAALADMEKRFLKYSLSNKSVVLYFKASIAEKTGNIAALKDNWGKFAKVKKRNTALGNCKACVADYTVEICNILGDYKGALEQAAPILAKEVKCAEVPQRTYSKLILTHWFLGDKTEAGKMYQKYKRAIKPDVAQLHECARAILYLAFTDKLPAALDLFEIKFPFVLNRFAVLDNFKYFAASLVLFKKLRLKNTKMVKLNLPTEFELYNPSNEYAIDSLYEFISRQATDIARSFDTRNGNTYYTDIIQQHLTWAELYGKN